jgi:hypothetical protein
MTFVVPALGSATALGANSNRSNSCSGTPQYKQPNGILAVDRISKMRSMIDSRFRCQVGRDNPVYHCVSLSTRGNVQTEQPRLHLRVQRSRWLKAADFGSRSICHRTNTELTSVYARRVPENPSHDLGGEKHDTIAAFPSLSLVMALPISHQGAPSETSSYPHGKMRTGKRTAPEKLPLRSPRRNTIVLRLYEGADRMTSNRRVQK